MKVATILLLVALMPISPVQAEPNAPVPAAPKATILAAPKALGRLFFTPEQRARMDVARQSERSVTLDPEQEAPEPAPSTVTLNGIITPSNGQPMVWINGRLQEQGRAPAPVVMPKTGRQVSVVSPDGSNRISLKVGQSIDTGSGKVEEGWRQNTSATQAEPREPDKNDRQ
ncbi:MAG: hypothetical protein Q8O37_07890 [Sulfuricellaceae bacterium]|nr:hypothetical protein [Sulfuricellaceae bacterium]